MAGRLFLYIFFSRSLALVGGRIRDLFDRVSDRPLRCLHDDLVVERFSEHGSAERLIHAQVVGCMIEFVGSDEPESLHRAVGFREREPGAEIDFRRI